MNLSNLTSNQPAPPTPPPETRFRSKPKILDLDEPELSSSSRSSAQKKRFFVPVSDEALPALPASAPSSGSRHNTKASTSSSSSTDPKPSQTKKAAAASKEGQGEKQREPKKKAASSSTPNKPKAEKRKGHAWYYDWKLKKWKWQPGTGKYDVFRKRPPKPEEPPLLPGEEGAAAAAQPGFSSCDAAQGSNWKGAAAAAAAAASSSKRWGEKNTSAYAEQFSKNYFQQTGPAAYSKNKLYGLRQRVNYIGFSAFHDEVQWYPKKDSLLAHHPDWKEVNGFLVGSSYLIPAKGKRGKKSAASTLVAGSSSAGASVSVASTAAVDSATVSSPSPSSASSSSSAATSEQQTAALLSGKQEKPPPKYSQMKKYGFVDSHETLVNLASNPHRLHNFHEVLDESQPRCLYFDIDCKENVEEMKKLHPELMRELSQTVFKTLGLHTTAFDEARRENLEEILPVILSNQDPKKYSVHVIFPMVQFESQQHQKEYLSHEKTVSL